MDTEQAPPTLWIYNTSFDAAATVASIYLTTSAIHILQAFIYRSRFGSVLVICGICEILGYSLHAASARLRDSTVLYATQLALIVLAPACEFPKSTCQNVCFTISSRCCSIQLHALRSPFSNLFHGRQSPRSLRTMGDTNLPHL
jgi:hypothetical protein